ncbi:YlxR family protein [Deinococcus sp.]|uniref:YlxR family protein n=1 Tax=Deinococcus sp. TaxID=47478 RepID=UPI003CC51F86
MNAVLSPAPAARHVPERSCVACRRRRPQGELLRLVRAAGVWTLQTGVRNGRGAYLCADTPDCWAEKRLRRAFGAQAATLSVALLARRVSSTSSPAFSAPARGRTAAADNATSRSPHHVME